MNYCGITGFTSRAEADAALAALPSGLTLMCGVLVSAKTLRGERNKHWRRYPRVEDIAGIFSPDPGCLNLIHYASDEPPGWDALARLVELGGPALHGFQFNVAWPRRGDLTCLQVAAHRQLNRQFRIVLQDRRWAWAMFDALEAAGPEPTDVLLDASGGTGTGLDAERLERARRLIEVARGHFRPINFGLAGGLCAETLPAVAPIVREHGLSIDAEGRLRDGDEGGDLKLDKVRAYLAAAGELLGERG